MARIKDHLSNRFKNGDHLITCQRTGRTVYASECVQEWNGLWVHRSVYEPKHPQLLVKGRPERPMNMSMVNPEPEDNVIAEPYVEIPYVVSYYIYTNN